MDEEEKTAADGPEAVSGAAAAPAEAIEKSEAALQQEQLPLTQPAAEDEPSVAAADIAEPGIEPAPADPVSAPSADEEAEMPEVNGAPAEIEAVEPALEPEKISPAAEPAEASAPAMREKMPLSTVIGIAVVLLVVIVLVFIVTRKPAAETFYADGQQVSVSSSLEQGKINIIEETKNDINVLVDDNGKPAFPKMKVTVYLGNTQKNPNSADCSLAYPLEREIDQEYDSNMINTMIGLLEPLSVTEKERGYVSAIPNGTSLEYLKLDDTGVMSVNLSGNISKAAGSCAVTAIRSQIAETISQFAAVKSVVICVDGNCREDEILQP